MQILQALALPARRRPRAPVDWQNRRAHGAHALGILGQDEHFEPIRDLLHGGDQRSRRGMTEFFDHRNRKSTPMYPRWHASYSTIFAVLPVDFRDSSGIAAAIQQDREIKINFERRCR
jgi:hypothetical protein